MPPRRVPTLSASAACLAALATAPGLAADFDPPSGLLDPGAPEPRRGLLTLGLQAVHTRGSLDGSGSDIPFLARLETDSRTLILGVDYRFAPRWSVQASLPHIRKRAVNDPGAHDPTALADPRPASEFLDDGRYRGTWQDWQIGLTYHTEMAGFELRPHAVLSYPATAYRFFGSAAPGQRLARLRLGFDASRRLGRSNLHYAFGYSYEFVEEVLDTHLDRHHLRLSVRYDFSPTWSASVFAVGRRGHGRDPGVFFAERGRGSELWFQHDRLLAHNHGLAGIGASWRFHENWWLAASTSRMVWGDSIHDIRYAHEVRIARAF